MNLNFLHSNQLFEKNITPPGADMIDIYLFPIRDYDLLADRIHILSVQEQERAAAFRQKEDRLHYLAGHILLRRILSLYLQYPATELLFSTNSYGKPYLANRGRGFFQKTPSPIHQIHFNLSHSGDYIALAFSTSSPIGIDIEKVRPDIRMDAFVQRFFHPDESAIFSNLPELQKQAFLFRGWTVREAFLKGIGCGLTLGPDSFCVMPKNDSGQTEIFYITQGQKDYSSWQMQSVPCADGYYCSVAYQFPIDSDKM